MDLLQLAFVLIVLGVFSFFSFKSKSLDLKGIILAALIGLTVFVFGRLQLFGGIQEFIVLTIFFIAAESATKYSRLKLNNPHETRTIENILGNSGAALIALFFLPQIAFFGAISAALSDTVSSEIGMLSKKKPRLITNLKKEVEAGTDGGITRRGIISGIIGGIIIALIYFLFEPNYFAFIAVSLAGISGSIMDSFLGAIFERKKMLSNTHVNFLASMTGALIAWGLGIYFNII
ncbi:MAG: DUF92 domain-containing protein [Candidatus Diapherotrites archaeon]